MAQNYIVFVVTGHLSEDTFESGDPKHTLAVRTVDADGIFGERSYKATTTDNLPVGSKVRGTLVRTEPSEEYQKGGYYANINVRA